MKIPGEKNLLKIIEWYVGTYDILTINNKELIIKPVNNSITSLQLLIIDELFNILHLTHSTTDNDGTYRIGFELKSK